MANTVLTTDTTPALDWADVTSAVKYWFQLSLSPKFTAITEQLVGLAASAHTVAGTLTTGKKYYWRFRTRTSSTLVSDVDETTGDASGIALRDAAARTGLAQGFKPNQSLPIHTITLSLKKNGTPTGDMHLEIWSDSGGAPSAQVGTDSGAFAAASVTGSYTDITFTFTNPVPVDAGTQYYLVLQGAYAVSAANYVEWEHSGSNSYADGGPWKHDGTPSFSTNGAEDHVFTTKYHAWGKWSTPWSFWLDTTARATITPTTWMFVDPSDPSDSYSFDIVPSYKPSESVFNRTYGRNLKGDVLQESYTSRARIQMDHSKAYVKYDQLDEYMRWYQKRKAVYLITYRHNEQDYVENIYKVTFPKEPKFNPLADGREDYYVGTLEVEEAALT